MEKKNKDHKHPPASSSIPLSKGKEDQNVQNKAAMDTSGKKPRTVGPSQDNVSSQNHRNSLDFQRRCSTSQPDIEHPLIPPLPLPTLFPPPPGYELHGAYGVSSVRPFGHMGSTDAGWQVPSMTAGATSSRNPPQVPPVCHHFGYPCHGFSGPWDPSSWWGQSPQYPSPCTFNWPRACSYCPPPLPIIRNCSTTSGPSSQRGVIQSTVKLSQKHQLLWDAQSAENVQLWAVIGSLQSQLSDCKTRLAKLESEAKPSGDEAIAHCTGTSICGQTIKRGRPSKSVASPIESQPRPRDRRPAPSKAPLQVKELNFQKHAKHQEVREAVLSHFVSPVQRQNGNKVTSVLTTIPKNRSSNNVSTNQSRTLHNVSHPQRNALGISTSSPVDVSTREGKNLQGIVNKGASVAYMKTRNDVNHRVPPGLFPTENELGPGIRIMDWWNMVNEDEDEDDASEEVEETAAESDQEDEEEMENVAGPVAENTPRVKDEGAYGMDTLQASHSRSFVRR